MGDGLAGRVVVVTGAAGGLGPVVAERAAAAGARLVLCGNDAGHLVSLADGLGLPPECVQTLAADLSDAAAVDSLAEAAVAWHGRVDAVLHLVGGFRGGTPLPDAPREDWPWLLDRVVTTTVNVIRSFARPLKDAEHGRFLTVSSPQATAPTSSNAAYGAAKAASDAWTLALANEFADSPATANIIVVPAIATPQMRAERPDAAFGNFVDAEVIADAMLAICAETSQGVNGRRLVLPTRGAA